MEDDEGKKKKSRKKSKKKKRESTYMYNCPFFLSLVVVVEESESPKLPVKHVASLKKKNAFLFLFLFAERHPFSLFVNANYDFALVSLKCTMRMLCIHPPFKKKRLIIDQKKKSSNHSLDTGGDTSPRRGVKKELRTCAGDMPSPKRYFNLIIVVSCVISPALIAPASIS